MLAAAPALCAAATGPTWSQRGSDAQHTGRSAYVATRLGEFVWSHATGNYVKSSPAVTAGGLLYIGSSDAKLYCLNATSGATVWRYSASGAIDLSSPAISADNSTIFFGALDFRVRGWLAGWCRAGCGEWRASRVQLCQRSAAASACARGVAPPRPQHHHCPPHPCPAQVYALTAATGALLWTVPTGATIFASPAVGNDGRVYIGSHDARIYAIAGVSGVVAWTFNTTGTIYSAPALSVDGTILYATSYDGNLYAVNTSSGAQLWNVSTGAQVDSTPAVAGGVVYIGSETGAVLAVDGVLGVVRWSIMTGGPVQSSAAVSPDGSTVFIGSNDGSLWALWAANGTTRWTYATGGAVYATPALSADGATVVCATTAAAGTVFGVDVPSGAAVWAYATLTPIYSSPAIGPNGTVFLGAMDSHVYAFQQAGPSGTPTASWTASRTASATGTLTPSSTMTPSGTATLTATGTGSATASPTGTLTATSTATATASTTATATCSPTASVTPTPPVWPQRGFNAQHSGWGGHPVTRYGEPAWTFATGDDVSSSPCIGQDGTVYTGSKDSYL